MVAGVPNALTDFVVRGGAQLDKLFCQMVDALPVAVYMTDSEGRLNYFNAAAVSLSGRVPELHTDRWCITWKLFLPNGNPLPHDQCPMAIALKGGEVPSGVECIAERPDGTRFWFMPYPVVIREANGQIIGGMNLLVDITDRKNAEIEAIGTMRQLRLITENMDVGVTQCTRDLRYVWVSRRYAATLGLTSEEIAGRPILDVIGRDGYEDIRPHVEGALAGNRVEYETQVHYRSAGRRWVHAVYVPTKDENDHIDGWIAVVKDVTDRRETEDRLRASERQLKDAQRLAKVGSWIREIGTERLQWSDEIFRIFGLPHDIPPEFPTFFGLVHPNDRTTILESEQRTLLSSEPLESEFRIIRPGGDLRFVRAIAETIRDDNGVPVRIVGAAQDITGQVEAQELLRESENRLRNAERLANLGHWDWDLKTNRVLWSDEAFRICGQPPDYEPSFEDLLRMSIPEDKERVEQVVRASLAQNRGFTLEFQIVRPDGARRTLRSISEGPLNDEGGQPFRMFGTVQDITAETHAHEKLFARQKSETVITLAGGVAHDFNNLLGSALAQAELGLAEVDSGLSPREELKVIRDVAIRGSDIVRQLMIYAGKENVAIEPLDLSTIVREMLELLKASVSKHAVIEAVLGEDLPAVRANAAQLRQIVMNLVINASEAIGDRDGVIRVTTSCEMAAPNSTGGVWEPLGARQYVRLSTSDTGQGMTQETQAKVFDPFFTTKSTGHGLGLATTQGIVRSLGGTIHLMSAPGKGTTFHIILPCSETQPKSTRRLTAPVQQWTRPVPATILVVEDEDPLCQAVAKLLRNNGFRVVEAADGSSAIDILHANQDKIDAILLDVTIPGASSREVVSEVATIRPETKVILTSAYSQETLTTVINGAQMHGFVRKPYQVTDLVKTLVDILSA